MLTLRPIPKGHQECPWYPPVQSKVGKMFSTADEGIRPLVYVAQAIQDGYTVKRPSTDSCYFGG